MLGYWLLELWRSFLELCYVSPHLPYIVPVLLLITHKVRWIKVFALLYYVTLLYGTIKLSVLGLIRYLYSALPLSPYFGSYLAETVNNYTLYLFSSESQSMGETPSFTFPSSSRLITVVFENFENFEYLWNVETNMVLLLGTSLFLNVVQALFRVKQLFKRSAPKRSAPKLQSYEWQGVWGSMSKCLGRWGPPVFWNFTLEQVQNPEKLVEHLEKVCCHPDNSRETQITATCWGLAHAYRALFNTTQGEAKVSGSDNKMTGTATTLTPATDAAATPTPATDAAASSTPVTDTAATLTPVTGTAAPPTLATGTTVTATPVTGTAAEPENQPMAASVAPVEKKKYSKRTARVAKDEGDPGSSREQEEEAEPEIITHSSSVSITLVLFQTLFHCGGRSRVSCGRRRCQHGPGALGALADGGA